MKYKSKYLVLLIVVSLSVTFFSTQSTEARLTDYVYEVTLNMDEIKLADDGDADFWPWLNSGEIYFKTPNGVYNFLGNYHSCYCTYNTPDIVSYLTTETIGSKFYFGLYDKDGSSYNRLWEGFVQLVSTSGSGEEWSPNTSTSPATYISNDLRIETSWTSTPSFNFNRVHFTGSVTTSSY